MSAMDVLLFANVLVLAACALAAQSRRHGHLDALLALLDVERADGGPGRLSGDAAILPFRGRCGSDVTVAKALHPSAGALGRA